MAKEHQKLTPMMRQYMQVKSELADDILLLFRMGDFYEIFFEDAVEGAKLMEITLTKRGDVPMAGIPYHALNNYLPKILETGKKVAIAEQMEDPKEAKGIVRREVTQIITPGTILDDKVLESSENNFIAAIVPGKKFFGLACLDLSTGDFRLGQTEDLNELEIELYRLRPSECLISESAKVKYVNKRKFDSPDKITWTSLPDWNFDLEFCQDVLYKHFSVISLDGFGCTNLYEGIIAAGIILNYVQNNLKKNADHVLSISVAQNKEFMKVDKTSQRNLELVEPIFKGVKNTTLVSLLDNCETPMGSRLLREWILRPLISKEEIIKRQNAISAFVDDQLLLDEFREALNKVRDIERILTRLNVGSVNARDLLMLKHALESFPYVKEILESSGNPFLIEIIKNIQPLPEITDEIERAIVDEPPLTIKEGDIIRDGYHPKLDSLKKGAKEGKQWIVAFETEEKQRTNIKGLKVRYNKIFGFYIEITKANVQYAPENYIRKQTLTNCERFITPELKEIESSILGSEDKSKALEYELFQILRGQIIAHTATLQQSAKAIAKLDVLGSLAFLALKRNYCKPELNCENRINIEDGRHPVVDSLMENDSFVPNDTELSDKSHFHLITGPNMAGKSTYIRQIALITLMAQMGSFIPASKANIGIMESIFTRIGAADDIARGQSTFMVEMVETANIINNSTGNSLVLLDEIGRGTSTYDGLSLAWAITEHLHEKGCLSLFATHYHELTALEQTLEGLENYNVAVRENKSKVIFLHKILKGGTDKSYGIYVAKLAGLPKSIITRSEDVLSCLEGGNVEIEKHVRKIPKKRKSKVQNHPSLFDWANNK